MALTLEMLGRGSHDLLKDFRKVILIKKAKAVGDRLNGLILVLKHLAGTLNLHRRIQVQRRLHRLLLKQGTVV